MIEIIIKIIVNKNHNTYREFVYNNIIKKIIFNKQNNINEKIGELVFIINKQIFDKYGIQNIDNIAKNHDFYKYVNEIVEFFETNMDNEFSETNMDNNEETLKKQSVDFYGKIYQHLLNKFSLINDIYRILGLGDLYRQYKEEDKDINLDLEFINFIHKIVPKINNHEFFIDFRPNDILQAKKQISKNKNQHLIDDLYISIINKYLNKIYIQNTIKNINLYGRYNKMMDIKTYIQYNLYINETLEEKENIYFNITKFNTINHDRQIPVIFKKNIYQINKDNYSLELNINKLLFKYYRYIGYMSNNLSYFMDSLNDGYKWDGNNKKEGNGYYLSIKNVLHNIPILYLNCYNYISYQYKNLRMKDTMCRNTDSFVINHICEIKNYFNKDLLKLMQTIIDNKNLYDEITDLDPDSQMTEKLKKITYLIKQSIREIGEELGAVNIKLNDINIILTNKGIFTPAINQNNAQTQLDREKV